MAVTVIDSKGELAALQASIDAQTQADDLELGLAAKTEKAPAEKPEEKSASAAVEKQEEDADDIEGEDGLTPRQKRELSAKMLKAIGKKHRELKEAEEFAAAQYGERKIADQRAQTIERELAELKAKAQLPQAAEPDAGKPQRAKFATDEAFWEAMTDWRVDQKLAKQAEENVRLAAERRTAEILETAKGRISKARELVPDFRDVTETVDAEVPPVVAGYMQKSEMFAELGYHLAKNPDLLAKLAKLPPDEQLVTIGKIESTLKPFEAPRTDDSKAQDGATPGKSAGTNGQSKAAPGDDETGIAPSRARGAAPVIKPINGSGAAVEVAPADMNIRETINDWSKKRQVNLGLRKRH